MTITRPQTVGAPPRQTDPLDPEAAPARSQAVLITRPEPGAGDTAARIAAMGLTPIVAPLLAILPTRISLPPPARLAAILLASGNAVEPLPPAYRCLPVLTVGDATAARAREAGFTDIVSADGDAVALTSLVRTRLRPGEGTLLLAAGRGQSTRLAATLREAGFRVARRVVYEAVPVPTLPRAAIGALGDDAATTILFFSAETARCFMRLIHAAGLTETLRRREAVTIGRAAAVALSAGRHGSPWARIRVAGKPTQDEMLALLR